MTTPTLPPPWKPSPYPAGALVQYEGVIYRRTDLNCRPGFTLMVDRNPPCTMASHWQPLHAVRDVEAMRAAIKEMLLIKHGADWHLDTDAIVEQLRARLSDLEVATEPTQEVTP